ncbi:MAG: 16S rRNA (adenine(1518)-N(6)/adenine(1519)-N(6))-dimethyltransferase RsmA [bacterium]|nr:16S rRNA (adenine(1518)-N(6)/adenine(1519)-N(6))-dimethyltransferase RsmA [bacterium]
MIINNDVQGRPGQKKIRAKKSLGQNFLKSEPALREIVKAGEVIKSDIILEIGPGKGILTTKLLATGAKVVAVEKDDELFLYLKTKFTDAINKKQLILIKDDILTFNIGVQGGPGQYKIIANIPYNITGAILKKFLTAPNQPILMVLMVQHEVAKRIVARDAKESLLSMSVKAYGEPKIVMKVPSRYFSPTPKVDSAVISIKNISRKFFLERKIKENNFWRVLHAGFAHKRKQLGGNLKEICTDEQLKDIKNKRAEDLTLEDWIKLVK